MRTCVKCSIEKPIAEFDLNRTGCKQCRRDYVKAWRHSRGENVGFVGVPKTDLTGTKNGKLTVLRLTDKRIRNMYVWECRCDCGTVKELATNSILGRKAKSCGHCLSSRRKAAHPCWKGVGEISATRWGVIRRTAKRRGLMFTITPEYIWELFLKQNRRCVFSNVELTFGTHNKNYGVASLDRIDSSKGYIEGNVQWVHRDVNFMKQAMTDEELIEWCKKIVKHRAQETETKVET